MDRMRRISELPTIDITSDTELVASSGGETGRVSYKSIGEFVREELTRSVAVAVIRCIHCGQWGARFCECRKCGAPIE
jgi:hypothetical protein